MRNTPAAGILSSDAFPIGLWWPPPPFETTLARYQEIVDAGFTFAHHGRLYADSLLQSYVLGLADRVGLQVLLDDPTLRWLLDRFTISAAEADFTLTPDEARSQIGGIVAGYGPHSFWTLDAGRLLVDGGGGAVGLSRAGAAWTDYTFSFDVAPRQTGGGGSYAQAGWAFRAQDPGNCYIWLLGTSGPAPHAPGYLTRVRFVQGGYASIVVVPLTVSVTGGTWYHVDLTCAGQTITTSVNGQVVDTTTDATFGAGRVGFREGGTESALYDNVKVTAPDGTVLLSDDFSGDLSRWEPPHTGHLSFAGIDLYDGPPNSKLPTAAQAVSATRAVAPDALPFVNLQPGFSESGYTRAVEIIRPPVLAFHRYPILAEDVDGGYFQNWSDVRAAALQQGLPTWISIQAVGFDGHAVPGPADLLWQINVSLAYGCKGVQYFSYWTPDPAIGAGFVGALLTWEGERTPLYDAARSVNTGWLAAVGRVLLPLVSESVQGANLERPPRGLPRFVPDARVAGVSGSPAVLGRFAAAGGGATRWLLVANYSRRGPASVTLSFGPAVREVETFDPATSRWSPAPAPGCRVDLDPGAGRLLRLDG